MSNYEQAVKQPRTYPSRYRNHNGKRFGRWLAIGQTFRRAGKIYWLCVCDCGTLKTVSSSNLTTGHSYSCGCLATELHRTRSLDTKTVNKAEYTSYCHAKRRCCNPRDFAYASYGGRGIEFRFTSFQQFLDVLGKKPSNTHSLDRIDNSGHYEPGNVRWATKKEQALNTRHIKFFTVGGETLPTIEWAARLGCSVSQIIQRRRRGWCDPCAVQLSKRQFCKHIGG